jgi:hemerythrin-like domain-containing protein
LPESSALTAVCREPNYGLRHVAIGTRHKTFAHIEIFDFLTQTGIQLAGGEPRVLIYRNVSQHGMRDYAEIFFRESKMSPESSAAGFRGTNPAIIEFLRQEHRNIEKLLLILERELSVFARGDRPDYEVIQAVIAYFVVYTDLYHHPPEDMIFEKLKVRDSIAAATIGDIAADHRVGAERLHRVAQAIESVLADRDLLRQAVNDITRDFIEHERRHIAMEERDFFPAAVRALQAHDWTEIASRLNDQKDPLFSEGVEHRFEGVRRYILQLEREAEAERA